MNERFDAKQIVQYYFNAIKDRFLTFVSMLRIKMSSLVLFLYSVWYDKYPICTERFIFYRSSKDCKSITYCIARYDIETFCELHK